MQLTLAPENGRTLTRNLCLTFFVRTYPFSFLTILSPKIYTVFCFYGSTSFSLFLVFLPYSCLLFSLSFFFSFLVLFSGGYSRFLFFSLILSESNFSVIFLFSWFLILSKVLFDFVLVSKPIEDSL